MNSKRKPKRHELPLCADMHVDDGIDPKQFFRKGRTDNKPNRKQLQLCSQIRTLLSLALASECDDPLLQELVIDAVEPTNDAGRVAVIVCAANGPLAADPQKVMQRLNQLSGFLRSEVARGITRKRTPELAFRLRGGEERQVRP